MCWHSTQARRELNQLCCSLNTPCSFTAHVRAGGGWRAAGQDRRAARPQARLVLESSLGPLPRGAAYPWGLFFLQFAHLRSQVSSAAPIPRKQLSELSESSFVQQEAFWFPLGFWNTKLTWIPSSLLVPSQGLHWLLLAYVILEVEVSWGLFFYVCVCVCV